MASTTEVRSGLKYGWALGENAWNTEMDSNLKQIGRFGYHLSVKDRDLATPPGSPANGDSYIVAAAPTGAWVGYAGSLAVWVSATSSWAFMAPRVGYMAYVEDEEKLSVYKVSGWSAGVAI